MRRLVLYLALTLAATAAIASTRIIPVAGHLPGANDTAWVTDLSLTNNNLTAAAAIDLVFYPDDGVARVRSLTLGARESLLLEDALNPAHFSGTNPPSWLGQLEIRSANDVSVSAHIFTAATTGGTYGSTYEDFDPAVLSNSGAMAGLISSAHYRSNIAFANPNAAAASYDYDLSAEDGSIVARRHIDIPAHSTRQWSIHGDVGETSDDRRFFLNWSGNAPGYVVGSIVDNKSGDPTTAQSTAGGRTTLFFPVVGKVPGGQSTFWTTSFAVSSTADVAGNVTFVYQDATGQTYTKNVAVPPHGTVTTDDLNVFLGAPNGSGALTVTATVRVVGAVRVFNTQPDGSTYGSSVLPQEAVVRASRVRIHGVRRDALYRLNIAISNEDSTATGGTIRLFDDHGAEAEVEPFHVEHQRSIQVSMKGEREVHAGEIEVETENGVPVVVIASNIDNSTGDTLVHESEQENERQHELEIDFTPRTAMAGVPVTFTVAGAGTTVARVDWTFGDGATATGLTVTHTYASPGEFEVEVDVLMANGAIVRDCEDVHVSDAGTGGGGGGTTIDFTYSPSAPAAGQQVTFTATGASSGGTFNWHFPGDVRKTGSVVTFTFAVAGSYEVEVELEREGSATLHLTHIVVVGGGGGGGGGTNVTAVDFSWNPQSPRAGQSVTFTATFDRQPPAGSVVKWRMPDNARPEGTSVNYTFPAAGSYKIRVELEQPGKPSIEREKNITIQP